MKSCSCWFLKGFFEHLKVRFKVRFTSPPVRQHFFPNGTWLWHLSLESHHWNHLLSRKARKTYKLLSRGAKRSSKPVILTFSTGHYYYWPRAEASLGPSSFRLVDFIFFFRASLLYCRLTLGELKCTFMCSIKPFRNQHEKLLLEHTFKC